MQRLQLTTYPNHLTNAGGVVVVESLVKLSDVGKVRVPRSDERPPEQLEGGLVGVEELGPVVIVNLVDINNHQGEADVDNDEDEEEDQDINDHVRHGDDDGARLSPHQSSLHKEGMKLLPMNVCRMQGQCILVVCAALLPYILPLMTDMERFRYRYVQILWPM